MTMRVLCGPCVAAALPTSRPRATRTGRTNSAPFASSPSKQAPFPHASVGKSKVGAEGMLRRGSPLSSSRSVRTAATTVDAVDAAAAAAAAAAAVSSDADPAVQFAASSMADALSDTGIPEWQIYYGFIAGLAPFVIAAYEFGKRILIQRQCELCKGSGLIQKGRYQRKCTSCGGFLPWVSWSQFLTSEAGNGGVVRVPKGQTSVFYNVEAARQDSKRQVAELAAQNAAEKAAADEAEDTAKAESSPR
mmetsp:Transcript_1099/g.2391  ORF Transcript_1099/g.2391 Transcript_1099/m.2391 type:complete len:248 (-) Transcript_1099:37-780(-)